MQLPRTTSVVFVKEPPHGEVLPAVSGLLFQMTSLTGDLTAAGKLSPTGWILSLRHPVRAAAEL